MIPRGSRVGQLYDLTRPLAVETVRKSPDEPPDEKAPYYERKPRELTRDEIREEKARLVQNRPEALRLWLEVAAQDSGYTLEELLAVVTPGRISATARPLYDELAKLVLSLHDDKHATLEAIASAIEKPKQTTANLAARGRELREIEQLEQELIEEVLSIRLPCDRHGDYEIDCPSCRRVNGEPALALRRTVRIAGQPVRCGVDSLRDLRISSGGLYKRGPARRTPPGPWPKEDCSLSNLILPHRALRCATCGEQAPAGSLLCLGCGTVAPLAYPARYGFARVRLVGRWLGVVAGVIFVLIHAFLKGGEGVE